MKIFDKHHKGNIETKLKTIKRKSDCFSLDSQLNIRPVEDYKFENYMLRKKIHVLVLSRTYVGTVH